MQLVDYFVISPTTESNAVGGIAVVKARVLGFVIVEMAVERVHLLTYFENQVAVK